MIDKKLQPVTFKLMNYMGLYPLGIISIIVGACLFATNIPFGWIALPLIWIPYFCFTVGTYKILTLGFDLMAEATPEEIAKFSRQK